MKIDLIKFLTLIWMFIMGYLIFEMWRDLGYMTDLVHSYIQMVMEYARH